MAKFFLKSQKEEGKSNLYLEVNRPKFGVRWILNTGIKVDVKAWRKIQSSDNYAKAVTKYFQTTEGQPIREKTENCDRIIKAYFKALNGAVADKAKLEGMIGDIVNTDLDKKREELAELKQESRKIMAEQKKQELGEVLVYYNRFFEGIKKGSVRANGKRYSDSSITSWRTFGNHLKAFLSSQRNEHLHFDDITIRTAAAFTTYCEDAELMKSTIEHLTSHFRKLCNYAAEEGVNSNGISFKIWKSTTPDEEEKRAEIVLSDEEIEALYNLPLSGYNEQCRDLWILGYFSGQRVSDYSTLTKANFGVNVNGTPVIHLRQQKTGNHVEIPILFEEQVTAICQKYNYNFPKLKKAAINIGIKAACKILSETVPSLKEYEVTLLAGNERAKERWYMDMNKRISKGEKLHGEELQRYNRCKKYATEHESGEYLFKRNSEGKVIRQRWELVTCHTTRRSMITFLHKSDVLSDRDIMGISGHKTLRSYEHYLKVGISDRATETMNKWKQAQETKKAKEVKLSKEA